MHLWWFWVTFLFHVVYLNDIERITIVGWAGLLILLFTLKFLDPLEDEQILVSWDGGYDEIRVLALNICRLKIWRIMYEIMDQSKTSIPDIIICQFVLDIGHSYEIFTFQWVTDLRLDLISIIFHPVLKIIIFGVQKVIRRVEKLYEAFFVDEILHRGVILNSEFG